MLLGLIRDGPIQFQGCWDIACNGSIHKDYDGIALVTRAQEKVACFFGKVPMLKLNGGSGLNPRL